MKYYIKHLYIRFHFNEIYNASITDADECVDHICQQKCIDDIGSYRCTCESGYSLNMDNYSCSGRPHT